MDVEKTRRERVIDLLADPVWAGRSSCWIAAEAGVQNRLVSKIRAKIGNAPEFVETRCGALVRCRTNTPPPAGWRRRLAAMLADPVWRNRSSNWIGQVLGVSRAAVDRYRNANGLCVDQGQRGTTKEIEQKRARVVALLADPVWAGRSRAWIARESGTSWGFVDFVLATLDIDRRQTEGRDRKIRYTKRGRFR